MQVAVLYTLGECALMNMHYECNYSPYVDGEYKLQPCFHISIHAIKEAGLNAQVQIEPRYENSQKMYVTRWVKCTLICSNNISTNTNPLIVPTATVSLQVNVNNTNTSPITAKGRRRKR